MPELRSEDVVSLRRQVLGHVQSLYAAGVEWLPVGAPLTISLPQSSLTQFENAAPAASAPATAPLPAESLDTRRQALRILADEVKACTKCAELCSTRTQTVFADGPPGVDLCFIGEAPGADEDAQGLPFVGAAGQLLNRIIAACGF